MDIYEALYTTRAMRRVRSDPVPVATQARILDAAVRAPSGGNRQNWRFLLVDDPGVKSQLAPLYRDAVSRLWSTIYASQVAAAEAAPEDAANVEFMAIRRSAQWLADHFEEVPLFLFPFSLQDPTGGSIFPAIWSAMLAARAAGVGSCLTMVLGLFHGPESLEVLGVPKDEGWVSAGCVSFGYPTGRWAIARRRPAHEVTYRNYWGRPSGIETEGALWSPGLRAG
jgi:nitroreductase